MEREALEKMQCSYNQDQRGGKTKIQLWLSTKKVIARELKDIRAVNQAIVKRSASKGRCIKLMVIKNLIALIVRCAFNKYQKLIVIALIK